MHCCLSGRHRRLVFTFLFLLTITAAPSAFADSLRGRVTDPQDRPVASASVLVMRGAALVTTLRTDANGQFGPATLPAGDYEIVAGAPGFRSTPRHVTIRSNENASIDLALTIAAVGESVLVSASQVETSLSRATDSVTVIDRQALSARQADTVADALRVVPGFGVVASGSRGAVTSFFPRGGESDYTLVLVDGVAQNAFGGGFDAAHLSAADADRIEVVRGPQSALYGGGAIGGIVQLITKHGGPEDARASFEVGGYGTQAGSGGTSGSHGAWSWGLGGDWLTSDGDTRTFSSVGGPVSNDDYERAFGAASVSWSDRASRRIRFDIRGGRSERGNAGAYGSDPEGNFFGIDPRARGTNRQLHTGLSAVFTQGTSFAHRLQLTTGRLLGNFLSTDFFDPTATSSSDDDTRRVTGRYQFDTERSNIGLSAGWEILSENADNTYITDEVSTQVPVKRMVSGWFVEARPTYGDRLFINAGARLERIQRKALATDGFSRPVFDDDIVWSMNPKVSIAWLLKRDDAATSIGTTKLRFGAGTGIKPPTAFEIAFTDNPSLKPERSRSMDVGIEQPLANGIAALDVTWFHNSYDDLIVAVRTGFSGASQYRTDNIANARAQGLELGAAVRPSQSLSVRFAWTWLDSEILGIDRAPDSAPAPYILGDPLLRRPKHRASVDLTWTGPRVGAFLSVNGRGEMADFEPNFASSIYQNPGYVSTSLGASFRVSSMLELFGRVENAFDRKYEEAFGYPALGRSATVGIRVARRD